MKVSKSIFLLVIVTALFAGCSNPVYVQRDASANLAKYKTYMWVETQADQNDTRHNTAFTESIMHQQVNAELSKRGWKEVASNPDVLVGHDILIEKSNRRVNDPVYSQPMSRVYYNAWARRWGTIYYPSQFVGYDSYNEPVREGTVTITMMDANTDKTFVQAWTTEQMNNRHLSDNEVTQAVKKIFKKIDKTM